MGMRDKIPTVLSVGIEQLIEFKTYDKQTLERQQK